MPQGNAHHHPLGEHFELLLRAGRCAGWGKLVIFVLWDEVFVVAVPQNRLKYIPHLPHQSFPSQKNVTASLSRPVKTWPVFLLSDGRLARSNCSMCRASLPRKTVFQKLRPSNDFVSSGRLRMRLGDRRQARQLPVDGSCRPGRLAYRSEPVESHATPWAPKQLQSAALWIGNLGGTNPQPILQESKLSIIMNKLSIIGAAIRESSSD
jgi:hypothetical protein